MKVGKFEEFGQSSWLDDVNKTNEYFFVIDNTEWPEALDIEPWGEPERLPNPAKDMVVAI